jgi:hypothetical protein
MRGEVKQDGGRDMMAPLASSRGTGESQRQALVLLA